MKKILKLLSISLREHVVSFINSWDKTGKIQQFGDQNKGGCENGMLIAGKGKKPIISATFSGGLKS